MSIEFNPLLSAYLLPLSFRFRKTFHDRPEAIRDFLRASSLPVAFGRRGRHADIRCEWEEIEKSADIRNLAPYEKVGRILEKMREKEGFVPGYSFNLFMAAKYNEYVALDNIDRIHGVEDLLRVLHENRIPIKLPKYIPEKRKPAISEAKGKFYGSTDVPIDTFMLAAKNVFMFSSVFFDSKNAKETFFMDAMIRGDKENAERILFRLASNNLDALPEVVEFRHRLGKSIAKMAAYSRKNRVGASMKRMA